MAEPIYKVFMWKYKNAWYKLSQEEQAQMNARNSESLKEVGVESLIFCLSYWADEEWLGWGVEKYPDIEAVQKHADNLIAMNWFNYIESKTILGKEFTFPQ